MTRRILASVLTVLGALAAPFEIEADELLIEFEGVFDYYDVFGSEVPALEALLGTQFRGHFYVPSDIGPDWEDSEDRSWHIVVDKGAGFSLGVQDEAYSIELLDFIYIGVRDNAGPFGGPIELIPFEFSDLVGFTASRPEGSWLIYELTFASSSAGETDLDVLNDDSLPSADTLATMKPTFGIIEGGTGIYARPGSITVSIQTLSPRGQPHAVPAVGMPHLMALSSILLVLLLGGRGVFRRGAETVRKRL